MSTLAFGICLPFTIFIIAITAVTLSMPPVIYIPMACIIGIGSYFICRNLIQSLIFPRWYRLAQQLDKTVEFRLGFFGQLIFIILICLIVSMMILLFKTKFPISIQYIVLATLSIALVAYSKILFKLAWWSPLYKGPALVATPAGIKSNSCFIPWSDVENASVCSIGRSAGISVKTRSGCSQYEQSIETSLYEPHEVKFTVYGALPESIAHYLGVRAKLQNQQSPAQK
jgi:hypothetical protein